jgi:hypothetical protein
MAKKSHTDALRSPCNSTEITFLRLAAIWRDVVSSMKARHFTRETLALLRRYAHAMGECERLEAEIDRIGVSLPAYDRLSQRLNGTMTAALSYARALRLTPKSNLETRSVARDPARLMGPRPWEDDDDPPKRKMWLE